MVSLERYKLYPRIDYAETFYRKVEATTELESTGITIPDGETVGIYRIRGNGCDPSAYVALVWDHEGENEKVFVSTKGDIDTTLDPTLEINQLTGDGTTKLILLLTNNNSTESPYIGGSFELVKV